MIGNAIGLTQSLHNGGAGGIGGVGLVKIQLQHQTTVQIRLTTGVGQLHVVGVGGMRHITGKQQAVHQGIKIITAAQGQGEGNFLQHRGQHGRIGALLGVAANLFVIV